MVPPKDKIKPTSQIIIGLYNKIKIAVTEIVEIVFGARANISEKISMIAMIPARTTEGLAPEMKTNNIIIKIVIKFEKLFPQNLLNKNFVINII